MPPENGMTRREELLAVATKLFAARGYHGTRMDDVADVVGLNKATVYHYFGDKNAVLRELFDRDQAVRTALFRARLAEFPVVDAAGRVLWRPVVEESPGPNAGPARREGYELARGAWAGIRLNYPFQSAALLAGREAGGDTLQTRPARGSFFSLGQHVRGPINSD